ncbi:MAG: hypothetical protein JXR56_01155, partial [Candidatus Cloacimonetes bacterium]|nr:hypothetical protein [Candidatus Cloacimonadota bacterium]
NCTIPISMEFLLDSYWTLIGPLLKITGVSEVFLYFLDDFLFILVMGSVTAQDVHLIEQNRTIL